MIPRPNYFVEIQVSNPEVLYKHYCLSLIGCICSEIPIHYVFVGGGGTLKMNIKLRY
jgi:hypothetical protein